MGKKMGLEICESVEKGTIMDWQTWAEAGLNLGQAGEVRD
jgi:hypothetical protein